MTHTELRHRILGIIRDITGKEFNKPIIIRDLKPVGYEVGLEFRQYDPTWYSADLPDDEFLDFIKKELCRNKVLKLDHMKVIRNTWLDHPLNDLISPYDLRRVDIES